MAKVTEAMGLATMNPMVGMQGPHQGSFIVNVTNFDKDLGDNPKRFTAVARSLDMDDNLYGLDRTGRFYAARKYDVMERQDVVEAYEVLSPNADKITARIIREADLPYEQRPKHKNIYELYTGKEMFCEDQIQYDPLFEKVELEKMSAGLQAVSDSFMNKTKKMYSKGNKESNYIPDSDYGIDKDSINNSGYVIESYRYMNDDMWLLHEVANTKFKIKGETMYNMQTINDGKRYYWKADMNANRDKYMKKLMFKKIDVGKIGWQGFDKPQPMIYLNKRDDYRFRCEIIVINDRNEILIDVQKPWCFPYTFPGGGIDKGETIEEAAARECKEEALVTPKKVKFMNVVWYCKFLPRKLQAGVISFVCVARYKGEYKGYVKEEDRDSFVERKQWIKFDQVHLEEPHRIAIERYLADKENFVEHYETIENIITLEDGMVEIVLGEV